MASHTHKWDEKKVPFVTSQVGVCNRLEGVVEWWTVSTGIRKATMHLSIGHSWALPLVMSQTARFIIYYLINMRPGGKIGSHILFIYL